MTDWGEMMSRSRGRLGRASQNRLRSDWERVCGGEALSGIVMTYICGNFDPQNSLIILLCCCFIVSEANNSSRPEMTDRSDSTSPSLPTYH